MSIIAFFIVIAIGFASVWALITAFLSLDKWPAWAFIAFLVLVAIFQLGSILK